MNKNCMKNSSYEYLRIVNTALLQMDCRKKKYAGSATDGEKMEEH